MKKITGFAKIKLVIQNKDIYGYYSGIEGYRFPDIVLEVKGVELRPAQGVGVDMMDFLLLRNMAFFAFTQESRYIEIGDSGTISKFDQKKDEPVIYEYNNQYIISNSIEKLACYNKYIYMVLELYCHYFKMFEKWLTFRLEEIKEEL